MSKSMQEILASTRPVKAEATICLDGELVLERDRLQAEINRHAGWESSSLSDTDPRTPLLEQLADVEARMREASQRFVFRSIGGVASSDLLAAHPSPKGDDGEDLYAFDPKTYPAALVAAASVDPVISVEEAEQLFDLLNLDQRNKLFNAAYTANNRSVDVPISLPASEPTGG